MSDDDALPEADRVTGAPHPRETRTLFGHETAEAAFLEAVNSGRLHHGWLITGPRGVGKATLAWRIARFLLATPPTDGPDMFGETATPDSLDVADDHPVAQRLRALSEPGLYLLRRSYDPDKKTMPAQIPVDAVRKLKGFFALKATENGRRVVIVDAADDLNTSSANALLKLLEEPPGDVVMLLISHQPARLLPTIRSRCRELRLGTLDPDQMAQALAQAGVDPGTDAAALAELAGGSVGEALALTGAGGLELYAAILEIAQDFPRFDRPRAIKLAESLTGKAAAERMDLMIRLVDIFLARLARAGLGLVTVEATKGELATLARLSPDATASRHWAEIAAQTGARLRHGRAVNLDPAALVLDMVLSLNKAAACVAA